MKNIISKNLTKKIITEVGETGLGNIIEAGIKLTDFENDGVFNYEDFLVKEFKVNYELCDEDYSDYAEANFDPFYANVDWELNEMLDSPADAIRAVCFSSTYNWNDAYVKINAHGNLDTFEYPSDIYDKESVIRFIVNNSEKYEEINFLRDHEDVIKEVALELIEQDNRKEVKNMTKYITGIFPEWIDSESRIGFAIEFNPKMFIDRTFFPEGCEEKDGYTKYKESFFEYHDNPWFWLDPEGDIVDYVEDLGELNLEDSLQLPMEAPSEAWRAMIKELEPLLRKALLRFCCNITICPKTLREFVGEFDFDIYKIKDADGDVVYKLEDLQKANLGDIENEEFADIEGIVDRLDIYYQDYFLSDIEFILDDIGLRVDNKDILDKWYTLSFYEDMYQYLIDIQKKYCQGDYCPQDLSWSVECLYYIIHPNELADDVEVKD